MKGINMKTFTIDSRNIAAAHEGDVWVAEDTVKFTMEQELSAFAATWPGARLVEIWNKLPSSERVTRFANRKAAYS
jgi:hypothetical protein